MDNRQQRIAIRRTHLESAMKEIILGGYIIECGVASGKSLNWITQCTEKTVYGFDSFRGLPEDWVKSASITIPKGVFQCIQPTNEQVEFWEGLYSETLPKWKEQHSGNIAFLHVDSDLYSSSVTILSELNDQIVPGSIIVFDDMYSVPEYEYWEQGEYKAFNEWKETYNRVVYPLDKTKRGQASFRIIQ